MVQGAAWQLKKKLRDDDGGEPQLPSGHRGFVYVACDACAPLRQVVVAQRGCERAEQIVWYTACKTAHGPHCSGVLWVRMSASIGTPTRMVVAQACERMDCALSCPT